MRVVELIGKLAIRTGITRVLTEDGRWVLSDAFTTKPIEIVSVTSSHIFYRDVEMNSTMTMLKPVEPVKILNYHFLDNNWTEFEPLVEDTENTLKTKEPALTYVIKSDVNEDLIQALTDKTIQLLKDWDKESKHQSIF